MRILLLSQQFDIRGGSDVMVQVSKRLLEAEGHKVFLFAATPEADETFPSDTHFERPSATKAHRFFYHREAGQKLDRFLEANPVDVAHAHIYYGKLTPAILGPLKARNIPLVQHLHEYRSFCSISVAVRDGKNCEACSVGNYWPGLRHRCNRGSLARSAFSTLEMYTGDMLGVKSYPSRFLAVSHFQKHMLVKQGMDGARIEVLYNPVDEMFFGVEREGGGGVLYSGRLEDYKGVFDLMEVAERMPNVPFVVVGEGEGRSILEKLIAQMGLRNITLVGQCNRAELGAFMARADVAFVPSIANETFGLAAGESMAAGLPVVVSDAGGLPEVVEDSVSGFVVTRGSIDSYAVRLSQILSDEEKALAMGRSARARVRSLFSEQVYQSRLALQLHDVVSGVQSTR